jgi:hypothetical protein
MNTEQLKAALKAANDLYKQLNVQGDSWVPLDQVGFVLIAAVIAEASAKLDARLSGIESSIHEIGQIITDHS